MCAGICCTGIGHIFTNFAGSAGVALMWKFSATPEVSALLDLKSVSSSKLTGLESPASEWLRWCIRASCCCLYILCGASNVLDCSTKGWYLESRNLIQPAKPSQAKPSQATSYLGQLGQLAWTQQACVFLISQTGWQLTITIEYSISTHLCRSSWNFVLLTRLL